MTRVLDLDLDFFLDGTAHGRPVGSGRLDPAKFRPWSTDDALAFLTDRCKLTDSLPGFVVENHGELFQLFGTSIAAGRLVLPLSVTHVDAHADLGIGGGAYINLMTELLFLPVEGRFDAALGLVDDGNWIAFAIACRWLSDLALVRNELDGRDRPGDLFPYYMESFDADNIEMCAMEHDQLNERRSEREYTVVSVEPKVPLRHMTWEEFEADEPFDVICLARSPDYTPVELDPLFDEIRERFIDEDAFQ